MQKYTRSCARFAYLVFTGTIACMHAIPKRAKLEQCSNSGMARPRIFSILRHRHRLSHVVHWRKSYWQRQNRTLRKLGNSLRCRIRMDPSVRKHVSGSNYRRILRFHQPIPGPKNQTILANVLRAHLCVNKYEPDN